MLMIKLGESLSLIQLHQEFDAIAFNSAIPYEITGTNYIQTTTMTKINLE